MLELRQDVEVFRGTNEMHVRGRRYVTVNSFLKFHAITYLRALDRFDRNLRFVFKFPTAFFYESLANMYELIG